MKKAMSIQSQWLAAGLALLTLVGTSACKNNDSEQKNFKAETGMLWWKKEATLVPLPYYLAKAPVPGQSNLAADDSTINLENASKSCWYYSEKPEDPFFSAKAVSPTGVTLDALLQGMSEGEHKETLKDLKDTWISTSAGVAGSLLGMPIGALGGAAVATIAATAVACAVLSAAPPGMLACAAYLAKIAGTMAATTLASTAATTTIVAPSTLAAMSAVTAIGATTAAGATIGGVAGGNAVGEAGRNAGQAFSAKAFEAKLTELVATASAEKRMKVEWKQLQALNDIVMKAPSSQATADVCARPEQLDRAAVAAHLGTASDMTKP
ncbi:MAG: hypothetical protein IOD12_07530 [Silvanigrellales bacterium]|nr:hypothetical protein [Silvanigrellales bacterium]